MYVRGIFEGNSEVVHSQAPLVVPEMEQLLL